MTTRTEEQLYLTLHAIRKYAFEAMSALECVEATCRIEALADEAIRLIGNARKSPKMFGMEGGQ
ncbi:MAG: hypothetical protein AB7U61_12780 [Methylocystis sp.]